MKKYVGYIPAALFSAFYMWAVFTDFGTVDSGVLIAMTLTCLWVAGLILHKGAFWGGAIGAVPAVLLICIGVQKGGLEAVTELSIGIALLLFYILWGIFLWKKHGEKVGYKEVIITAVKLLLTGAVIFISLYIAIIALLILSSEGYNEVLVYIAVFVIPSLLLPLIWLKRRKKFLIVWGILAFLYIAAFGINYGIMKYEESITVNQTPNIAVYDYLPFKENSKIVKRSSETLKLTDNLPRIDGAAALFPVYSAFVNATYPDTTKLDDGVFCYNNTPDGYRLLAEKEEDLFIGVYPSEEQIDYATECGTTFEYTQIGREAFVFFVHKKNPVLSLTTEQIKGIYSGEITNWKEVGGRDEEIVAFQRNEGSGSQSMLKRFMGDTPIADAPIEQVNDFMAGIITQVSNYKNKTNSIGFSFRFYVEGIIKNPDIKMIAIDGVEPTAQNIKNGTYSLVTPIYAVTYKECVNENTDRLIKWMLSDEGQEIIEESGYVGM